MAFEAGERKTSEQDDESPGALLNDNSGSSCKLVIQTPSERQNIFSVKV